MCLSRLASKHASLYSTHIHLDLLSELPPPRLDTQWRTHTHIQTNTHTHTHTNTHIIITYPVQSFASNRKQLSRTQSDSHMHGAQHWGMTATCFRVAAASHIWAPVVYGLLHAGQLPVRPARTKCRDPGSNRGPSDLRSDALPTELSRPTTPILARCSGQCDNAQARRGGTAAAAPKSPSGRGFS